MARWSKQPNEPGLRSVGQTPRGLNLKEAGEELLYVRASGGGWSSDLRGWYWYGMGENTINTKPLFKTKEAARDDASVWYRAARKVK